MDRQLEFSVIIEHSAAGQEALEFLQSLNLKCQITTMFWESEWAELVKVATYSAGPNVSQVAAPAVINLAAMNALAEFTSGDVASLGGASVFLPAAWQTVKLGNEAQVWSIPWLADVRVVYYWRDLLEQAGVDESSAFDTPDRFHATLQRLQAAGMKHPLLLLTHFPFAALHYLSSWVWGVGEDFVNADGRSLRLNEPHFRAAMRAYFDLRRYLPSGTESLTPTAGGLPKAVDLFAKRQVAVAFGDPSWLRATIEALRDTPHAIDRLGVALPPGPPYVGGSNLVIWKHTQQREAAVRLIRSLISPDVQASFCQHIGLLPTRLEALRRPPYSTDPRYQVLAQAAQSGRSYPTLLRWGLIEENLSRTLTQIWSDLAADPRSDLDKLFAQRIDPLVKRLNSLLAQ
jgi:multiple sugar transport system substrate-binding protein